MKDKFKKKEPLVLISVRAPKAALDLARKRKLNISLIFRAALDGALK